jgi:hypothetical protein
VTARRVEIEIAELVLHGLAPLDRDAVGRAVQAELARLVDAHGLGNPGSGLEVAARDGGRIFLTASYDEGAIGSGVAQAAFRATREALDRSAAR